MKSRYFNRLLISLLVGLFVLACSLPGFIPLPSTSNSKSTPLPEMEKDADNVLEVLKAQNFYRLETLAQEQYSEDDFAKPGTLTFTAQVKNDKPVYFSYGWCATSEEILQQNYQHIAIELYFNGDRLDNDVVHSFVFTTAAGMYCGDFGVLLSDWPPGEYQMEAVATFDEKINDGLADYEAGDYIFEYTVTVDE